MASKTAKVKLSSWEKAARALPKGEVKQHRFDVGLALRNAQVGLGSVRTALAEQRVTLPGFRFAECEEIIDILSAVDDVLRAVHAATPTTSGVMPSLSAVSTDREQLLSLARTWATLGHVEPAKVRRIERGKGARDQVQDVLALVDLLSGLDQGPALPVSTAQLEAMRARAQATLGRVGAKPVRGAALKAQADFADRLSTLAFARYERVRAAAAWLYSVDEMDERAPALTAGRGRPRKASAAKPAPVTPAG